ncbi:MAG: endonuclease III [bacterium]
MPDNLRKTASEIIERLDTAYPQAHQELNFSNPFQLLIATILAAQCTDAKVNQVTEGLFKKYPDPESFLPVDEADLQNEIRSITFYRNKAKGIKKACRILVDEFGGQVPATVEDLTKLPYVGRKTANVVLANAMGIAAIGVDTHTLRVPNRLGWVETQDPDRVEAALCELLPREKWHRANLVLQWHGRYTCKSRKPLCSECVIFEKCSWLDKEKYGHQN